MVRLSREYRITPAAHTPSGPTVAANFPGGGAGDVIGMSIWIWTGFVLFVLAMLAIDLFVIILKAHVISTREALRWTAVTVVLALLFAGVVYYLYEQGLVGQESVRQDAAVLGAGAGRTAMLEYLTG